MQKILFCDIDRTLIFDNHLHSLKELESLREFHQSGNLLVYCTARNKAEADFVIRQFSLPYDYLILNNGSRIEDAYGTELFSRTIPGAAGMEILRLCRNFAGVCVYFYDPKRKKNCSLCNGWSDGEKGNSGKEEQERFWTEANGIEAFDMIGIRTFGTEREIPRLVRIGSEIRYQCREEVQVTLNTLSLAVTAKDQTKGSAMEKLLTMLGKQQEVYCIGDSANDVSMFGLADTAYTFYDAAQWVKDPADEMVAYVYEAIDRILTRSVRTRTM